MIAPNPHVAAMAPYALADLDDACAAAVSLAQNESFRPPSPAAVAAGEAAAGRSHLYPDPDWTALRAALGEVHGLAPGGLLCGAGSMELIGCLAAAYAGPGRAVLSSEHGYALFRSAAAAVRARCDLAPETGFVVDVDALLATAREDTRLVFVANPANPTGTRVATSEIARLRSGLPAEALLVVDEAYGEFADGLDEPAFDLVARGDVVVLRTLSKAYGLAGARVGWGLFPAPVAAEARKLLNPNNVSTVSQAMAAAAVRDQAYMRETVRTVAAIRDRAAARLAAAGLAVIPSSTNFLLLDLAGADAARRADEALRRAGLVVRGMAGYGLAHCLRATVVEAARMERMVEVLSRCADET